MTAPTRTVEHIAGGCVQRAPTDETTTSTELHATLEPELSKALIHVAASLRARYPTASPALVLHCIGIAFERFRDARVRHFLPILIERRASDALREHVTQLPDVDEP